MLLSMERTFIKIMGRPFKVKKKPGICDTHVIG